MATVTPEENQDRVTLTEKQFCARVSISVTTAWALRKKKQLPHFKCRRRIFYSPDHVTQFLASIEQNATTPRSA